MVKGPGGTDVEATSIEVIAPPAPVASVTAPGSIPVGQAVTFFNRSTGVFDKVKWYVNNEFAGESRDLDHIFDMSREHVVVVEVEGPGGKSRAEHRIKVVGPDKPTASFVIGTPVPRVGKTVVLTDTSTGEIATATWFLPGRDAPLVVDYLDGGSRSIEYEFQDVGKAEIRLVVHGPGGESPAAQNLNVRSRFVQPEANVTLYVVETGHDYRIVEFKNRSKGSIVETEYDFGDGSPTVLVAGTQGATHRYGSGEYTARVRIIGPAEFVPETVEFPVDVPKPLPAWVWHLFWIVPSAIALLGGVGYAILSWRRHQEERRLSMLVGTLQYKPKQEPLAPYKHFVFHGSTTEEEVSLDSKNRAIVRASSDPMTNQVEHSIEVIGGDGTLGPVPLVENDRTTIGQFEFNLVQA